MRLRGVPLELHQDEALSNAIRRDCDFYEAYILDYLRDKFPVQKTIIDAGANIGNHTVFFAEFFESEAVLAFEPIKENFDLLEKNVGPYAHVQAANVALSAHTGQLKMKIERGNMGASTVCDGGEIMVPCIALDRLCLQSVTLMKLDVEGYEPAVIEGAQETIYRCHPLILIEDWENHYGKILHSYGFKYQMIKKWNPEDATYLYKWEE